MLEFIKTKIKAGLDKTLVDDIIIDHTKKVGSKVKETVKEVNKEIRKHIITAISAAFAFLIALFWRDAIQEAIRDLLDKFGASGDAYIYKIIAALIVTVMGVIGIFFLARLEKKD